MIADRHVLVIRQQRVVGPELTADVHRVMNAGVEIRVIADFRRQMQCARRCVVHMRLDLRTMRFETLTYGWDEDNPLSGQGTPGALTA